MAVNKQILHIAFAASIPVAKTAALTLVRQPFLIMRITEKSNIEDWSSNTENAKALYANTSKPDSIFCTEQSVLVRILTVDVLFMRYCICSTTCKHIRSVGIGSIPAITNINSS